MSCDIFGYLPYLQNATNQSVCTWISKEGGFAYPVYSEEFLNFIMCAEASCFMDVNYMETLRSHGICTGGDMEEAIQNIENAGKKLAMALLTQKIREERFCEGAWANSFENRVFYRLLKRLKELEP